MKIAFDSNEWIGNCSDGVLVVIGESFGGNEQKLTVRCQFNGYTTGSDSVVRYLFYDRATSVK